MQAFRLHRFPVVVVLGATGAGKSKLALELGRKFNGEILSADSMQVYKGLDIITNKVTQEEQDQCPHHLLGIVHPLQRFTVVDFRNRAIPIIDGLLSRGKMPIIVGGTNYYIEALLWKVLLAKEGDASQELLYETQGEAERLRIKHKKGTKASRVATPQSCQCNLKNISLEHSHDLSSNTPATRNTNCLHSTPRNDHQVLGDHTEGNSTESKMSPSPKCNVSNLSETLSARLRISEPREGELSSSDQSQCASQEVSSRRDQSQSTSQEATSRTDNSDSMNQSQCTSHSITGRVDQSETSVVADDSFVGVQSHDSMDGRDFEVIDVNVTELKSSKLHELLSEVDPQMASKLHPNDKRKIVRSLQVYEQHGLPHSEILEAQRTQEGGSHLGGPLRYPDTCVFWVQSEQTVLDTRLDKRVDEMMEAGLLAELGDFHKDYNEQRLAGKIQEEDLYTQGIFQSIGFKEFHDYLVLEDDVRRGETGDQLLEEGIEKLKTATRQYARRQLKWIRNRFLKRGSNAPAVYGMDSTDPKDWDTNVLGPAGEVVQAMIEGREPEMSPLPCKEPEDNDPSQMFVCHICEGRQFVGHQQWTAHLKSRRHHKKARKQKLRELMAVQGTKIPAKPTTTVPGKEIPVSPAAVPGREIPVSPAAVPDTEIPVSPAAVPGREIPVSPAAVPDTEIPVSPAAVPGREIPVSPAAVPDTEIPVSPAAVPGKEIAVSPAAVSCKEIPVSPAAVPGTEIPVGLAADSGTNTSAPSVLDQSSSSIS